MPKRDYYDILGVSRNASADEIRKAHRKLARQYHPDMNKNNASSTEKFKEVQEAYDVLSDAEKKKSYDQFGHAGPQQGFGGPPPGGHDPYEAFRRAGGAGGQQWRAGPGTTVDDIPGGFSSIFEEMFGGGGPKRRGRAHAEPAEKGQDIEHSVQLSFEDAARGTTLPLRMQLGKKTETIEIKIPPGVNDGSRIRIKGKGQPGPAGPGDLFILCKVAPHPTYRREGLDVLSDVPVSIYDALLGGKINVHTLDGEVTLTLPPGTGSGAKMRIKGRGIKRAAETGDHFAVIKILVPKDLSPEAINLVKQLQAAAPLKTTA